jgi:subtilisin family serine protease
MKDRHEADVIVRAFAERHEHHVDIGGVLTADGNLAYMYAKDRLLVREQYLRGEGGIHGPQRIQSAHQRRGVLDVLERHGVATVEVRRVAKDIVVVRLNPEVPKEPRDEGTTESSEATPESNEKRPEGNDSPASVDGGTREANGGTPEGDDGTRPGDDETGEGEERDARFFLRRIVEEVGGGVATLDQVLISQPEGTGCPATEAQETYDLKPYPPVCPGEGGRGVRIYVADTGFVKDTVTNCPWLKGVCGDDDPSVPGDGTILSYGGHGTFVAGVIRCMAPCAEIVVRCVFDIAGSALESDFVPKLYEGFADGADIFHVTVSSPTKDYLPLMAFEAWMEDLRQHKGVVCLVPAGNYDSSKPHWPAAFPGLISVGALATDGRSRAYFSDYGGWVDVYAPGQNLVNAFATGTFTCEIAPYTGETRQFFGMAQWSGTSFSTPIVTGLIAARMAQRGESAEQAAAALLAKARGQAIPGLGPVLYPGCEGDDERCGCCDRGRCGCDCGWDGCRGHSDGCGCSGRGHGEGHRRRGPMPH